MEALKPDHKYCSRCLKVLPISDFYLERKAKDGHKKLCKVCSTAIATENRRKLNLRRRLAKLPRTIVDKNLEGLNRLIAAFEVGGRKPLVVTTWLHGAAYPVTNGLEIRQGTVAPVIFFQTGHERIQKSLGSNVLIAIASEMFEYGIEVVWEKLPPLTDAELDAMLSNRERIFGKTPAGWGGKRK